MTRLDLLLAAMVAIWGGNFSLVKVALRDFPELAFNAFRLVIASTVFLLAIWHARRSEGPSAGWRPAPRRICRPACCSYGMPVTRIRPPTERGGRR